MMSEQRAKDILYIDLDGVLVSFQSGIDRLSEETKEKYADRLDDVPGIFALMDPIPGAIRAFQLLVHSGRFVVYILSTAPWNNDSAWTDKVKWVKQHLGESIKKRLILSHRKDLLMGQYLIDDRKANGAGEFKGTHIHFGVPPFENWDKVLEYFGLAEH